MSAQSASEVEEQIKVHTRVHLAPSFVCPPSAILLLLLLLMPAEREAVLEKPAELGQRRWQAKDDRDD